ncbi:MAG: tRNA pseudouridine(55) synthase [Myxococcaceae bacterium]|nr:tRNA pseudouridine(55) synthase [Myxococcaceae bacterium]
MAVWLVHKTTGVTSFEALQAAKPEGKSCHGGALDPFASGLLPVLVGKGVHVFHLIHELPKTYVATLKWGEETDNLDLHGKVIATGDASNVRLPAITAGWQDQVPPEFSNKRIKGERAWKLARAGEKVELPPSRVYLHEATWLDETHLRVVVRGGFYVRSLARDLGRANGARAHLTQLHREQIGPWRCPPEGTIEKLPLEEALPWLPTRALSDAEVGALRKKQPLEPKPLQPPKWGLPPGFPPTSYVRAVHLGRTAALLRADLSVHAWL